MTAIQKISVYQRVKAHGPTLMVPTLRLCNSPGTQTTGDHFNSRGHSLAEMEFSVLETFKKGSHHLRKEREKFYINKFNTKYKGLNNKKGG